MASHTANPTNTQVAAQLRQLAALLQAQGVNRFKVKAYRRAAETIARSGHRISEVINKGSFPKIPGVGASIQSAITEIVQSGTLGSVQKLSEKFPKGTAEIADAARISINDAKRIVKVLNIETVEQLKEKLADETIVEKLGPKLAFTVRAGLADIRRLLWDDARELADQFHAALMDVAGVEKVAIAGSLRRGKDTVGTLKFVVKSRGTEGVTTFLRRHGGVENLEREVVGDEKRLQCKLAVGPAMTIRFAAAAEWGSALVEETGSHAHLQDVEKMTRPDGHRHATEEAWYAARSLPWIPPELREGRGEVSAAKENALSRLIELADIRGDLHAHTTASDGSQTIEEMARAARAKGYAYLAITDHSKSLKITNGLDEKRLREQGDTIDKLNARLEGFRILKGSEVDILEDGSLDFKDAVLKKLDVVMASIHSRFGLAKHEQTRRLIRAIENPYLTCVGHLTGRKLLRRPGYELDIGAVLKAVKKNHKLLEINASPDRLDINDEIAKKAKEMRIPILINTDAHSVSELEFMQFGVQQARRGWRTAADVVNTLELPDLLKVLKATRK